MASIGVSRLVSFEDLKSLVEQWMTYEQIKSNLPQVKGYPAWVFGDFAERLILVETVS